MVRLDFSAEGTPIVIQQDVAPTVYLDHWALRKFSEDQRLADCFTRALEARGGTLALSWLNLVEFAKVTDSDQGRRVEEFYAESIPRIFFLDSDPFGVIQRENDLLLDRCSVPIAPHADAGLLSTFANLKPDDPTSFTVRDLFRAVQRDQLGVSFDRLGDTVAERIQVLRNTHDVDPKFRAAVARLPSGPPIQHGTRYVLRELVRTFLIDRSLRVTRNHAIDLMHAVVPLAYCEFVLLDKHWEAQVRLVRTRLARGGIAVPLGRVYSERRNGIERFLRDFDRREV